MSQATHQAAGQAGIELERVSLTYRGRKGSTEAIAGLDLVVQPRTFVSVLGPSGCGKSTILKLVSGLLPPTSGTARVGGRTIDSPHRDVGIVFQKPTLLPWKSVLANILVAAPRSGAQSSNGKGEIVDRARELIRLVRLEGFENHYPGELSGGMQQRVTLARALLLDPPVLLMDEPFAALDALTREQMALELLKVWSQNAKTVLFVTHSIPEAVFLSDRVVILSPRPTHVVEDFVIDLPRPRDLGTMATAAFGTLCDRLRQRLLDSADDGGGRHA